MKRLLAIALVMCACSNAQNKEYCLEVADCENGNDSDVRACEAALEYQENIGKIYECEKEWEDLLLCRIDESQCEEINGDDSYTSFDLDDFEDACSREIEDWFECLDDGSKSTYDNYESN